MTTTTTAPTGTTEQTCPGWCPGPEQHHRSSDGSITFHELKMTLDHHGTTLSIQDTGDDPHSPAAAHVALPNGDELDAHAALHLGRTLIEAHDLIRNNGERNCSPTAPEPERSCTPLATASVVVAGWWLENFAELRQAVDLAAATGAVPHHFHGGRVHVMESDVIAWHASQPPVG